MLLDENFDNTAISSIELPEGVENIGERVSMGCEMLTDVVIPSSVKSIGEYAFEKNASWVVAE